MLYAARGTHAIGASGATCQRGTLEAGTHGDKTMLHWESDVVVGGRCQWTELKWEEGCVMARQDLETRRAMSGTRQHGQCI